MSDPSDRRPSYTKKDFMSDQQVRWCPGCGDYSILSQVQAVFAGLGRPRESFAILAGIGCSGRFPYYMRTYGFHTLHGRAPAFATGLKMTRPDLSVWVVTGDGDGLSIGANHLAHTLRRNVDLNVLLFNNRIYGLTKGQASPTSEVGKTTRSTPAGSVDEPLRPLAFALGSGATFVARSVDIMPPHLRAQIEASYHHAGTSFLEIYQNCNIFNDGAFADITARAVRSDRVVLLEHGEPMRFGANNDRGLVRRGSRLEAITLSSTDAEREVLAHDETDRVVAGMLASLEYPDPVPLGVLYREQRPTYDAAARAQVSAPSETLGWSDLHALVHGSDAWKVGDP